MHPLYPKAQETVDALETARLKVARTSAELAQAEYALRLAQARVERGLIKRVGSENALAPTVSDRTRIFTLALDTDGEYKEQLRRRDELEAKLREVKVEVASLRDKLNVMLAAMRTAENDG